MPIVPYDRAAAIQYAHQWAYARNPRYFNFEDIGGDCTNFASQVLFAGAKVQNTAPNGWYYHTVADRAPAWTGVRFLEAFLCGNHSRGPFALRCGLQTLQPGDLVLLQTTGVSLHHAAVVVAVEATASAETVWVAAHSEDCDNRPLAAYAVRSLCPLHILGVRQ